MGLATGAFPPALAVIASLRVTEPQRVPPFLGSAVHGALGRAVWHAVCAVRDRQTCRGCLLESRCAYPRLFETPAPPHASLAGAGIRDQAPRPLAIGPEPGWTPVSGRVFASDEVVPIRFTLVGPVIEELPVLVVALRRMADRGIGPPATTRPGRRRAPLALASVTTADGTHVIYDAAADRYSPPPRVGRPLDGEAPDRVRLELITPVRLKHAGRIAGKITPEIFCDALTRRVNALALLFGSGAPAVDENVARTLAREVRAETTTLDRVHVRRYSARQRRRMDWPGLMGELVWSGPALGSLWPLLRFGELVQVGKATALGFGRYRLTTPGA